ncbi:MAG: hypothetical protein HY246_04795, partial [Proteobacteria bacterium]|nr:hypothetical protein [Pseudomonadota bacterium]
MAEHGEWVPHAIFGLNAAVLASLLMILTYAVIITEKLNRSIVALL